MLAAERVARQTELQLLMVVPRDPPMLAGIPAMLRTVYDLASSRAVNRIFLGGESSVFVREWRARLPAIPWQTLVYENGRGPIGKQLDTMAPLVLLATHGVPDVRSLLGFLDDCQAATQPRTWVLDGAVLAVYYPAARDLPAWLPDDSDKMFQQAAELPHALAIFAPRDAWQGLSDPDAIRSAERRVFRSLRKDSDGYLARLDRALSIAISYRLARTPVTPNHLTALSLTLGLLGAALLASADYWIALFGAVLLWSGCVLDGCDGEVARLKLLASTAGARFDQTADNLVHLATFVAVVVHVHRIHPEFDMLTPGLLLGAGVVLSMALVWWLILRRPDEGRRRLDRILERIASRDYVYLIVILAALQRLEWFVWAAALGANLFWVIVWSASGRARMTTIERVAFTVAAVTLAALVWVLDPAAVGNMVLGVGWGMALILSQEIVAHVVNALGWRLAFTAEQARSVPLAELVKLRIAGDAVNYLTPSATVAGEFTRTAMLNDSHRFEVRAASVMVAKCAQTLAQFLFAGAGVGLAFWTGALDMPTSRTAYLVGAGLAVTLAVGWFGFRWFGHRARRRPARPAVETGFGAIVSTFRSFIVRYPGRCAGSTLLFALAYAWGAFEAYWICHFIGLPVGVGAAFMIEALSTAFDSLVFMVPAKIGTQEGGKVVVFAALGLSAASGLAFGVVRHIRELSWAALGLWLRWTHRPASASRPSAAV